MLSIARHTYPQMVWRNREKRLWNPIQKKALKNRPEERVRLRIMEALIQGGWSRHRISTEEAVGELGDTSMRTDIICYNQQFEPRLLIECKAEHIPISTQTAEQVARYNQKVEAPFLLMTNGVTDHWYAIEDGSNRIQELEDRPDIINGQSGKPEYVFEDWKSRGFVGEKASPVLRKWFGAVLPAFWLPDRAAGIRFLHFSNGPSDVDLNHYYRITSVGAGRRLALSTLNTAFGGNRMIIILNEEDENKAVMEINLDLLFDEKKGNASVYSRDGIRTFALEDHLDLPSMREVDTIVEQVDRLFIEYVG